MSEFIYLKKNTFTNSKWEEVTDDQTWEALSKEYGFAMYSSALDLLFSAMRKGSTIFALNCIYKMKERD